MQLNKINGNTFYIDAPTNIGVFQFKDKYSLVVDAGNNNQQAAKIDRILGEHNLKLKYLVNSHNHMDHSGGDNYFKEHYPGSLLCASDDTALFLENEYLFPLYLYGASPIRDLRRTLSGNKKIQVDMKLQPGLQKINDEKFEVISLPGHARGQIGIGTKDRVCFLGDSIFSGEILAKYPFPFLLDISDQMATLESLSALDYDYFLISHSKQVIGPQALQDLAAMNQQNIQQFAEEIIQLLDQPHTRESLLEELVILHSIPMDFKEYHFAQSTVGAYLTYLFEQDRIDYQVEEGKLYYFQSGG